MQVVIQKIPENLQEFEHTAARAAEHICALFLCALALFDRDKDVAHHAMDICVAAHLATPYDWQQASSCATDLRSSFHLPPVLRKAQRRKTAISRVCRTR